jgi:arabinogalactan oligomer/maltooligosaccharide transport system permease protein
MKEQPMAQEIHPADLVGERRPGANGWNGRRVRSTLQVGLIYLYLIGMSIFALFPIYYVVQASFAGAQNLYTTDSHFLPANPTLDNYGYAFTELPLFSWILNTLTVALLTTVLGVVFSTTGAYALARFRFAGRRLTLRGLLALQAFPGLLALPAYYLLLNALGLVNNLLGLVLIYAAGALVFSCWNTKSYFDMLPVELEQAAMIDGATSFQAFIRIALPLAAPAVAVSALFSFLSGWNEFALANLVLNANSTGNNLTFILGLYSLQRDFRTPWGIFAAASIVISVPLMLIFFYSQRFFRSGLTIGSMAN